MKKRILALALAGTTAFSVFGGAMSANAATDWWTGSTHVVANDDAYYRHYTPAGDITWGVHGVGTDYVEIGKVGYYFAGTEAQYTALPIREGGSGRVVKDYAIYSAPGKTGYNQEAGVKGYTESDSNYSYFASYEDFAKSLKATRYTSTANGVVDTNADNVGDYIIARRVGTTDEYWIFDKAVWDQYIWENGKTDSQIYNKYFVNEGSVGNVGEFFLSNAYHVPTITEVNSSTSITSLGARIMTKSEAVDEFKRSTDKDWYMIITSTSANGNTGVDTNMKYVDRSRETSDTVYTGGAGYANDLFIEGGNSFVDLNDVEPTFEDVMAEPVELNTVYLYDYYEDLPRNVSLDDFADAWADGKVSELLYDASNKTQTTGTIEPDTSYLGRDLRMDVNYAWIDFLDNLGISDASNDGLTLWAENMYQNYVYNYFDATVTTDVVPVKNASGVVIGWDVRILNNQQVDLYNFGELIENILYYAPSDKAATAQTSELVYLMQQYNKYVNEGFVDVKPVETDEWGDLLVSLALAPTEAAFRTTKPTTARCVLPKTA